MHRLPTAALVVLSAACVTASPPPQQHGTISTLSEVEGEIVLCDHKVPERVCVKHHPDLEARFKKVGDWCPEHGVPESQCLLCHPDLTFSPLPKLPAGADLTWLAKEGEDVAALDAFAVAGKVTLFDFYADWCAPCRKVDAHVYALLAKRPDLAVRKLNVVSWDTPLAKRYLADVPNLPYLVVYGPDGKPRKTLTGLDLAALDEALK